MGEEEAYDFAARTWCRWCDNVERGAAFGNKLADPLCAQEEIDKARAGHELLLFTRKGKPKYRDFRITDGDANGLVESSSSIVWNVGKKKKKNGETRVILRSVSHVVVGQDSPIFERFRKKKDYAKYKKVSFSIFYNNEENDLRSIDLACDSIQTFETWIVTLFHLLETEVFGVPESVTLNKVYGVSKSVELKNLKEVKVSELVKLKEMKEVKEFGALQSVKLLNLKEVKVSGVPESVKLEETKEVKQPTAVAAEPQCATKNTRKMASLWEKKIEDQKITKVSTFKPSPEVQAALKKSSRVQTMLKQWEDFEERSRVAYEAFKALPTSEQAAERAKKLAAIKEEIVESENVYYQFLTTIVERMVNPCRELVDRGKMSQKSFANLFNNIEQISPVHKLIVEAMNGLAGGKSPPGSTHGTHSGVNSTSHCDDEVSASASHALSSSPTQTQTLKRSFLFGRRKRRSILPVRKLTWSRSSMSEPAPEEPCAESLPTADPSATSDLGSSESDLTLPSFGNNLSVQSMPPTGRCGTMPRSAPASPCLKPALSQPPHKTAVKPKVHKTVASILIEFAVYFRIYAPYISGFEIIQKTYDTLEHNSTFKRFRSEMESHPDITLGNMMSYLIMPVQRLPRYRLLLRELLKYTVPNTKAYREIEKAIEKVSEVTGEINERKRAAESQARILEISMQIGTKPFPDLLAPSRTLLHEGTVQRQVGKNWKSIHAFAFNDIFMYTTEKLKFLGAHTWSDMFVDVNEAKDQENEATSITLSTDLKGLHDSGVLDLTIRTEKDADLAKWREHFDAQIASCPPPREHNGSTSSTTTTKPSLTRAHSSLPSRSPPGSPDMSGGNKPATSPDSKALSRLRSLDVPGRKSPRRSIFKKPPLSLRRKTRHAAPTRALTSMPAREDMDAAYGKTLTNPKRAQTCDLETLATREERGSSLSDTASSGAAEGDRVASKPTGAEFSFGDVLSSLNAGAAKLTTGRGKPETTPEPATDSKDATETMPQPSPTDKTMDSDMHTTVPDEQKSESEKPKTAEHEEETTEHEKETTGHEHEEKTAESEAVKRMAQSAESAKQLNGISNGQTGDDVSLLTTISIPVPVPISPEKEVVTEITVSG